jgi:hypothetical protein
MVPGVGLRHQHLPGVRWEAGTVVAEVEPPLLPIRIVGGHSARWVQLLVCVPQCELQAAGTNCPMHLCLAHGESVEFRAEEVNPEMPVRRDPRESFANSD